ncbi:MAG: DUF2130 domain-containing protein [Candidatus Phytoplasma stylosanthis]|uniref:DUF2130 domain-containing protein n=1 Tax=Candidatus Phytoplasma stylosanthis TaxID=2798314 RepID=UPI00293A5960|nr:DUF2130 domain-containing protein [Candidatus Phytoplasma stylosanthis]MDV3167775.1 DUF2130 domain-containing protein [Candidatus Phytoplasma stylosanthis]MDV3170948.1 DUF2130 domain-containing protein [Candidatus Phytoplasma stylosanthis]MDV3173539.1 DUF2130 domain-containing protein [Candidatus Phytoplasma stylosanthis]MDV3174120.1 DUF2130 domain-containing protein [Candidatus Phytoplasma stylosanthis]MDV3202360.1 DUF2130 domain-containing protein [Candidatus Phytoplasma stylosanthis]
MKKIKVFIKNLYELELKEDGQKGDIIDLKECLELDMNFLQKKMKQEEIDKIKLSLEKEKDDVLSKIKQKYKEKIKKLIYEKNLSLFQLEKKKNDEIFQLQLKRSNFNIKIIGENLEKWCDNEIKNQILIMNDISWEKDNKIINGTKGDFIYKLYLNSDKKENEVLISALLEMKTEVKTLNNISKQKNEQYFKKLNKDRNNKNLEFAILVSELEYNQENDVPIQKVNKYKNMFIVRPAYLTFFLNVITSLGYKNKELILALSKKKEIFKEEKKIQIDFQKMKNKILNDLLNKIEKNLINVYEENEKIKKNSDALLNSYMYIQRQIKIILEHHFQVLLNEIKNFKISEIINQINNFENYDNKK